MTVSATRTDRGIEDQPMRVEVVDREEIDEKVMMTPGDVVMLLNETGGMRVQATSPSLGAASIRIQGMRGRYTRFLSDGSAALRRAGVAGPDADSTARSWTRGGDQRCRLVAVWRRRDERRRQFGLEASGGETRTSGSVQRIDKGRD